MYLVKPEKIMFENARDVLNYVSRFGAPSFNNYAKLTDAMYDARNNGNSNKVYGTDVIIDTNIMEDADQLTFEDIVDIIYRNQKINDTMTIFKCIGCGVIGYAIGRIMPHCGIN